VDSLQISDQIVKEKECIIMDCLFLNMLAASTLKSNSFLENIAVFAILAVVFGGIGFGIKTLRKKFPVLNKNLTVKKENITKKESIPEESTPEEVKIKCPNCSQEYIIPYSYIGKKAKCETCNNDFTVTKSL